jgi:DNA polymerase I-like protein with 3'-5' exonuclease and polymerase domains
MVSEHVVDERKAVCSLADQVFRAFGVEYKGMVEHSDLANAPELELAPYNTLDAGYTALKSTMQRAHFEKNPDLIGGSQFFLRTLPALVNLEKRGIAVDRARANEIKGSDGKDGKPRSGAMGAVADCEDYFNAHDFIKTFRAKTGRDEFGPGSDKDFCDLFYTALDLPAPPWKTTGGGLPSDKAALNFIVQESGDPRVKEFVAKMLTWRQYETLITNFLNGFEKNTHDDGLMHPSFPLHNVESYRGSSEGPNFQNLPKRNEEQSEFRKIIIPHLGTIMGEIDASGSELATAAMVTGDTLLTQQVNNKVDLHKYWAARLYEIREQDVKKAQRQLVKSKFVFPEIYGSWYRTIAKDLALDEKHVKRIEQEFWSMYIGVKAWQDDCLKFYDRYGYVKMPMGFRRYAPLSRNQIFNTAIQGTSFHMLLEALWRADCDMIAKGMRSGIEIEVHDSIVPDMVDSEVEDVCQILVHRMVEKQFAWQGTVKRSAEMSIGPTWGDLEEIDISSFLAA